MHGQTWLHSLLPTSSSSAPPLPQAPRSSQAIAVGHPGSPHLPLGSPMSWKGSGSNVGTVCRGGRDLGHICRCASVCWGLSRGLCAHQAVSLPVAACAGRAILALQRFAHVCVGAEGWVHACAGVRYTQCLHALVCLLTRNMGPVGWWVGCALHVGWVPCGACRLGGLVAQVRVSDSPCALERTSKPAAQTWFGCRSHPGVGWDLQTVPMLLPDSKTGGSDTSPGLPCPPHSTVPSRGHLRRVGKGQRHFQGELCKEQMKSLETGSCGGWEGSSGQTAEWISA